MTRLKLEERTNVLKWYYKNHGSIVTTQRRFRRFYNFRTLLNQIPSKILSRDPTEAIYCPKREEINFCKLIAGKVEKKEIDIGNIDWSDEAHFHLSGHVNKQNMRIWGEEKPDPLDSKPLTQEKVTVWCAVGSKRIIGLYFYENNEGSRVTVNGVRYLDKLKSYYIPTLRRRKELGSITFQQDGALPHIAKVVLDFLREKFDKKLI
ncbi:Transposable element Tc3 transposase [Oopsacas minuta]|uniref:Transposable element Tc3 transposase n=1 Tax=Oopsacas minuta TaxID=111878 RepID=A0AAV7JJ25_9METZ|nr:Transposable element Tc3 transposase [Oopsacas minuta]